MTTSTRSCLAAFAATLLALGTTGLRAQYADDGYDQQQWWNPGDWFDEQPQYNLFSDRYWNDTYDGYYDTDDYGYYDRYDDTFDYDDYGYGNYDPWETNDYGYYDTWDYDDSQWGYNDQYWDDTWDQSQTGLGAPGESESGFGSDWED